IVQHVALVGIIDVTSGRGDVVARAMQNPAEAMRRLMDFKRSLERQGMVVDAYLDLVKNKIEGEMTLQTDYLILGHSIEDNARGLDAPRPGQPGQGDKDAAGDNYN